MKQFLSNCATPLSEYLGQRAVASRRSLSKACLKQIRDEFHVCQVFGQFSFRIGNPNRFHDAGGAKHLGRSGDAGWLSFHAHLLEMR